jgi:predicted HicB family RNase H-like nuclease
MTQAKALAMNEEKEKNTKQFALRLARSAREAVQVLAKREGISVNHFISLAVAEKISRIEMKREANTSGVDKAMNEQSSL